MSRAQLTSTVEQNTGGAVAPFVAGKNKIINGDFNINQRNFTSITTNNTFGFDRWYCQFSGGTVTYTPQTFTAGSAPVAGYESTNYLQIVTSGQSGTNYAEFSQKIEDVRTFANQTITVSFWAKAASGTPKVQAYAYQSTGGVTNSTAYATIGTTWQRYTQTITIPSLSGKTINAGNYLQIGIIFSDGGGDGTSIGVNNNTFSFWGVQAESGSVATPFTTASNTLQGELALCQRYFQRIGNNGGAYFIYCIATAEGSGTIWGAIPLPVTMRTTPSMTATSSGSTFTVLGYGNIAGSSIYLDTAQSGVSSITMGANTLSGFTQRQSVYIRNTNDSTGTYISLSAEL